MRPYGFLRGCLLYINEFLVLNYHAINLLHDVLLVLPKFLESDRMGFL
jgi:hypothetical protein